MRRFAGHDGGLKRTIKPTRLAVVVSAISLAAVIVAAAFLQSYLHTRATKRDVASVVSAFDREDREDAAAERTASIAKAKQEVSLYCLDVIRGGTDAALYRHALEGGRVLVAIARQPPEHQYDPDDEGPDYDPVSMEEVLADVASLTEDCDASLSRRFDRAREALRR